MSFRQLGLFRRTGRLSKGISVGTVKVNDAGLGLSFTIHADVAQQAGFKSTARVGIAFGEGPDEGLVALFLSDDGLKFFKATNRATGWGGRFNLGPKHLPMVISTPRPSEEVAYEVADGVVKLVLPTWAYKSGPSIPFAKFRTVTNRTIRHGRAAGTEPAS